VVQQLAGAATVAVIVLTYIVLVQVLTAACVLLAQFITLQIRALRSLIASPQNREIPAEPHQQAYKVGGGLARW
jgi:hypothetical protein